MARRIRFRKPFGRSYGYFSLQPTLRPDKNAGVLKRPLPERGNDLPTVAPASRQTIDGGAARGNVSGGSVFNNADRDLNAGPPPVRIRRLTTARHAGAVQKGTGTGVTGPLSFDPKTDGGSLHIPHQRIPRWPKTVTAFRRTIDLNSTIPARGIAAPVKRV